MVEILGRELSLIGLQENKGLDDLYLTRVTHTWKYVGLWTMVAILHGEMTHKYLGRRFPRGLNIRTEVGLMY